MPTRLGRLFVWIAMLAIAGAAVYAWSEHRRTRGRSVQLKRETVELKRRTAELGHDLAGERARADRLEGELAAALRREQKIVGTLDERRRELEQKDAEIRERLRSAMKPMPEGVRLALVAINDCLRADGHDGLRFIQARGIDNRELLEAEIVEFDRNSLETTFYDCARVVLTLDREAGELELTLLDGRLLAGGRRLELPEEGFSIRLAGIWGPMWEARLPYLLQTVGAYSAEDPTPVRQRLIPAVRDAWIARLERVLELAETELRYELTRLRGIGDHGLEGALLLGYGSGRLLEFSAEAGSLALEVDKAADSVSLLMRDGILRKAAGETTIPTSGYRIFLPGLKPAQAIDLMLGMVVYR